jgi:hypothetical protein
MSATMNELERNPERAVMLVAISVLPAQCASIGRQQLEQLVRVIHSGNEDDDDRDEGAQQPVAQLQQMRDQRASSRLVVPRSCRGPPGGSSQRVAVAALARRRRLGLRLVLRRVVRSGAFGSTSA